MAGKRITPAMRRRFLRLIDDGMTVAGAAKKLGFSDATGYRIQNGLRSSESPSLLEEKVSGGSTQAGSIPDVKSFEELSPLGKELLKDFALFSEKVLCRTASPWRVKTAERVVELILDTSERHYAIGNAPPSVGKTTLWTTDIPLWLLAGGGTLDIAIGRGLRIMLGHRAEGVAVEYANRLRSIVGASQPYYDVDLHRFAEVCMAEMFGRFQPDLSLGDPNRIWSKDKFTVAQPGSRYIGEKEATVFAVSRKTEFIGQRGNYIVWDDLVTEATSQKAEAVEGDSHWMETIAEPRLEPPRDRIGSVFFLIGQRIGPSDLYRDRASQVYEDEDGHEQRKYALHFVFPAHYELGCDGEKHRQWNAEEGEKADGCLLDEKRLPWREILKVRRTPVWRTVYQQEDSDPASVLVPAIWLDGGLDVFNEEVPGCWDKDRGFYQWPSVEGLIDYASVDVATSGFWAFEHWSNKQLDAPRYLIFGTRRKMGANEFLDWSNAEQKFTGLLEQMQQRSVDEGHPIRVWIIEANAFARHLTQVEHFHRWQARWGVQVIPHQTQRNKNDPRLGVTGLLPGLYREGLKRLPRSNSDIDAVAYTEQKKREMTTYVIPTGGLTTDTVMADWIGEHQLTIGNVFRLAKAVRQDYGSYDLELPPYLIAQQAQDWWEDTG